MKYNNILKNFEFEGLRAKGKVSVAIFRTTLSSLERLHLWTDFDFISHECLV